MTAIFEFDTRGKQRYDLPDPYITMAVQRWFGDHHSDRFQSNKQFTFHLTILPGIQIP